MLKKDKKAMRAWVLALCALAAMIFGLTTLVTHLLLSNENRNLALTFDECGYMKTHFEGTVVFKKDFTNVSLDFDYAADGRYPVSGKTYTLLLTNENGQEVTNVTAGAAYHFLADVDFEKTSDYTLYYAGQAAQSKSKAKVRFLSDGKTLYTIRFDS